MAVSGIRFSPNGPTGIIGKLVASVFFALFLAIGLVFFGLILREEAGALRTWTWRKTPCEILSSSVRDKDERGRPTGQFYFDVTYRYSFGGQTFTSDHFKRQSQPFSDYSKVARLAEQYPSESQATCYVNSAAPEQAVLVRDNFYLLPFLLIPLVFIAFGVGSIYYTWRPKPAADTSAQSISARASLAKGQWVMVLFCGVFLLVGSGLFCGFFLRPMFKIAMARTWPAVPCVVLSSQVDTHRGDKGATYSINILYRYELNGREFKSNTYHFMGGSSSGYRGKQAIVNLHPPGRQTFCYVNPRDPTEAVLERGFTSDLWFGLIPLVFVAFGAIGMTFALRTPRQNSSAAGVVRSFSSGASARELASAVSGARATDSVVLKPKTAPWAKLLGIIFIALFWNGIVSVFVGEAVQGWRSGRGEWFLTLFMVPFVLVGLVLLGGIVYQFLAMFNPRPRLCVAPGAVPLGGELRVEWELSGRTNVLRKLDLRLQGREEAKYRRGTSTCIDVNVFADIELASLTNPYEMRSGTRTVTIPAGLMHSFASKNNSIIWSLRLHGDIPRWPDIKEEFPITVLPAVRVVKETV